MTRGAAIQWIDLSYSHLRGDLAGMCAVKVAPGSQLEAVSTSSADAVDQIVGAAEVLKESALRLARQSLRRFAGAARNAATSWVLRHFCRRQQPAVSDISAKYCDARQSEPFDSALPAAEAYAVIDGQVGDNGSAGESEQCSRMAEFRVGQRVRHIEAVDQPLEAKIHQLAQQCRGDCAQEIESDGTISGCLIDDSVWANEVAYRFKIPP